ncbi:unnamed protein product [Pleuronectes platessa]|uniref:Uncharacterized protein n=1 Tax=Pleuronectes platessa TaxID=8262 RepID=A0A9N7YA77_PLEPL|nr:unnamed protein product [Pleuronectes platessa]
MSLSPPRLRLRLVSTVADLSSSCLCREVLFKHRADSSCGALRDTGGAAWPQVESAFKPLSCSELSTKTFNGADTLPVHPGNMSVGVAAQQGLMRRATDGAAWLCRPSMGDKSGWELSV